MPKLIAFGCSFTRGDGLVDRVSQAWPAVLGGLLDLETENHGIQGASNKEIWRKILNTPIEPDDTVIVCWTFSQRTMFNKHQFMVAKSMVFQETFYYKHLYSHKEHLEDYALRVDHINSVHNIYNLSVDRTDLVSLPKWAKSKFLDVSWTHYQDIDKAQDKNHPGVRAHNYYADAVHRAIVDNNYYN